MKADKKQVFAWCLFDWANSSFTTLVVTFIYGTYFTQAFFEGDIGTTYWTWGAIAPSSILVALSSPVLGAIADRGGSRRRFLVTSTLVCVAATTALAFVAPSGTASIWMALVVFVVANVSFEIGMVFYNAFLPVVATPESVGRVSGYGWGLGYAGGLVCLVIALLGFVGLGGDPMLPLPQENGFNVRASNFLVAGWFLLFSLPMFFWIRESGPTEKIGVGEAFADLKTTLTKIVRYPQIVRFLVARLIFNDGLVTIFAMGGIYAAGTFGMEFDEVIMFGIALNVSAGVGAMAFGAVDDKLGGRTTILLSLAALIVASILGVLAPDKRVFWVAGLMIGLFAGPNQAASRSLMARFVPEKHQNEFFGFFAFSGKATAFLGPLLLGLATAVWGQRAGVATVLVFFVVGAVLLLRVDEKQGVADASR